MWYIAVIIILTIALIFQNYSCKRGSSENDVNAYYSKWLRTYTQQQALQQEHVDTRKISAYFETYALETLNGDSVDARQQLVKAIHEKHPSQSITEIELMVDRILSIQAPKHYPVTASALIEETRVTINIGLFRAYMTRERWDVLCERGNVRGQSAFDLIGCICMAYSSLWTGGNQLAVPRADYQAMVNLGFTLEGFASPLNSQIIMCKGSNLKFCSIFPIDRNVGSIGSFFDNVPADSIVNPPFTEALLLRAAQHLVAKKCRAIFWGPNWLGPNRAAFHDVLAQSSTRYPELEKAIGLSNYDDANRCYVVKKSYEMSGLLRAGLSGPVYTVVYYLPG